MKKTIIIIFLLLLNCNTHILAQEKKVQNRPYLDLRRLHYGFLFGTQLQDLELNNVGPQMITLEDGTQTEKKIVADVDNWNPGFTVGVLAELKINNYLALRIIPSMHFGSRHIKFINNTDLTEGGNPTITTQNLKTTYMSIPLDLKYSAERFNNYRPYLMAGINEMINLTGQDQEYIQLKRMDTYLEVGLGCDFYLPFFKLIPELKFCYGLSNCLDNNHANKLTDVNKRVYTQSVDKAHSKMIVLSFYFE